MSFRFHTLLTVSLTHGYYDGACGDVGFVLPADTVGLLNGGRLLTRVRDGVLHVLYDTDAEGAPLVSVAGRTLRIGLKQLDPNFENITERASPTRRLPCYRNTGNPSQLDAPRWMVGPVGRVFSHRISEATRPVSFSHDTAGVMSPEPSTRIDEGLSEVSFDFTPVAPGAFTVSELYGEEGERAVVFDYYLDPELQQEDVLGVLELRIDASFYTAPPAFTVDHAARRETLKYYLVAENHTPADADLLDVVDAGYTEDGRPRIEFTRVAPADFTADDLPAGLLGGANAQVVLFKSRALVPRRQKARRKLQLVRTSTGDVLLDHLPQPTPDEPHADLIIHVSKP
ncbi:hypothetical protein LY474_07945 [Myxococcus stipitatus]|uniref:hypothetical protein n=1 Tax=Myxococcus stipitatus TaxID=83455 RepID=UPI001F1F4632|nr:hypothetical protein [Myxococcus stipitatus]MCE9667742.1 hypothetical protein [Myxococcus stipitatus]